MNKNIRTFIIVLSLCFGCLAIAANGCSWFNNDDTTSGSSGHNDNNGSSGTLPGQVTSPNPANGAINVPITATLTWSPATNTTTYDIYFGTTTTPNYQATITGTLYNPSPITINATYYWRIDSKNSVGTITGTLWNFQTITFIPWTKLIGTIYSDHIRGITTDTSGNIYAVGQTGGVLENGITNTGQADIFIIKYAANGAKQWIKQLGTPYSDSAKEVATDTDGNIYVLGSTGGDLGDGVTNTGESDIVIMKYNSDGIKQWIRQIGTSEEDWASGLAIDSANNIYICGQTWGSFEGYTNTGSYDFFIVKYNAAGQKQWLKQAGTDASDGALDITINNTSLYVVGTTEGEMDGCPNTGDMDLFIVKYNTDGERQWTRQFGTELYDDASCVVTDINGNIYIGGSTVGDLDGNHNANPGTIDILVIKYNADGERQWTRELGTTNLDGAYDIAIDTDGYIYVVGNTSGNLDGESNSGATDGFIIKYNTEGIKQWTKLFGSVYSQVAPRSIAIDGHNIYIAGSIGGNLDGNTNAGDSDGFIVKYNTDGIKQ
jgi:uncharacterized delta-60 repeat protein